MERKLYEFNMASLILKQDLIDRYGLTSAMKDETQKSHHEEMLFIARLRARQKLPLCLQIQTLR